MGGAANLAVKRTEPGGGGHAEMSVQSALAEDHARYVVDQVQRLASSDQYTLTEDRERGTVLFKPKAGHSLGPGPQPSYVVRMDLLVDLFGEQVMAKG